MGAWRIEEMMKLIELWRDNNVQEQLEGCKRNRSVFKKTSAGMTAAGFVRMASKYHDRIKKLKKDYKKVKDYHHEMGRGRKQFKHYELLNDILGSRPSTQPAIVLDVLAPPTCSSCSELGANTADTATEWLTLIEEGKEPDLEITPTCMNQKGLGKMKHEQKVKREG